MRLALDIGGTLVKCAIVSNDGKIVRAGDFATQAILDNDSFAQSLVTDVLRFLAVGDEKPVMVGAGMPGFVDGKRGFLYESPNLPNLKNFEPARVLADGVGLPAYVDNDATAAAWGEFLFGHHEGVRDMLVVTLGTGIGGGLVLDGRLYRGSRGFAGEIGQMPIYPDGPPCPCGGKGCLERYIGKGALEEDYRVRAGLAKTVDPKTILERAKSGEVAAQAAWDAYGERLGIVLAGASNLLDLGVIILTGGIAGAWSCFSRALMESYNRYLITPYKDRVPVRVSELGGSAGILGAAFLDKAQ
jgi:glucokinase